MILALDTCHSGGFGDDWVRAPGRMGLFSSDGDVLSDTAEPRRAGGYLSWYLRRGVLGEADYKPHDGVLHAGEFTDYLLEGMVRDHRLMNPDGSVEPAQRFVLQRGGVVWTDVMWVYPRGEDLALPQVPPNTLESPRALIGFTSMCSRCSLSLRTSRTPRAGRVAAPRARGRCARLRCSS